jgi:TolA-binding protein
VAVRPNVLENRDLAKRLRAYWTPTIIFLDAEGTEHHRFMGYLPPDEYGAQIHFARGREAFVKGNYQVALDAYQTVVERYPNSDAAPESLYWTGVCAFKLTKDEPKIYEACREVVKRYPHHIWAKKLGFLG